MGRFRGDVWPPPRWASGRLRAERALLAFMTAAPRQANVRRDPCATSGGQRVAMTKCEMGACFQAAPIFPPSDWRASAPLLTRTADERHSSYALIRILRPSTIIPAVTVIEHWAIISLSDWSHKFRWDSGRVGPTRRETSPNRPMQSVGSPARPQTRALRPDSVCDNCDLSPHKVADNVDDGVAGSVAWAQRPPPIHSSSHKDDECSELISYSAYWLLKTECPFWLLSRLMFTQKTVTIYETKSRKSEVRLARSVKALTGTYRPNGLKPSTHHLVIAHRGQR